MGWLAVLFRVLEGVFLAAKTAREIEELVTEPGAGRQKKDLAERALDIAAAAAKEGGAPEAHTEAVVSTAKKSLDAVVTAMHAVKLFTRAGSP